jgi:Flp pilus assembly protein CpaB
MEFAQKMLSTRSGSVGLGLAAAGLAALILLVYLNQYRSSVEAAGAPVRVLVAKSLIEEGTPGDAIGIRHRFQSTEAPQNAVKDGAINDPSVLRGQVAVHDIFPGQQLTTADFASTGANAIGARLVTNQRAIAVPVDIAHGIIGKIEAGDRVDVYASFPDDNVLKIVLQNALVLDAPSDAGTLAGGTTAHVVIRAAYKRSAEIAYAADNGKVWLVLRPRAGARVKKPAIVTQGSLIGRRAVGGRG